MRSHCAVYVDAGYLLAAAATRVTGTSLRGGIQVDHGQLIEALADHAAEASGLPLLRVYWYDAARNGLPDQTQEKIGLLPRVKTRLGRIGFDGEQKGVDLRIGLDMVAHARNAAIDVIFLVSGDDDLTEAVEEAQAHGVQVTILAVPTNDGVPHSVSRHLQRAADGLELLAVEALDNTVVPRAGGLHKVQIPPPLETERSQRFAPTPSVLAARGSAPPPPAVSQVPAPVVRDTEPRDTGSVGTGSIDAGLVYSSTTGAGTAIAPGFYTTDELSEQIDQIVNRVLKTWLAGATAEQREALLASRPSIPRDVDRALLMDLSDLLNVYDLSDTTRHLLRARFWLTVDQTDCT